MTDGTRTPEMACARPTEKYPEGRTGTAAGYGAHKTAGQQACRPCTDAQTKASIDRRRALPVDELTRYRQANAEAVRRRNARDPGKRDTESLRYRDGNRAIIRAAKEVPCADCGIQYPYYVMQFDHLDGDEKAFNIGQVGPTSGRPKLLAEIAKCEVVCANCHSERSYRRLQAREAL